MLCRRFNTLCLSAELYTAVYGELICMYSGGVPAANKLIFGVLFTSDLKQFIDLTFYSKFCINCTIRWTALVL